MGVPNDRGQMGKSLKQDNYFDLLELNCGFFLKHNDIKTSIIETSYLIKILKK